MHIQSGKAGGPDVSGATETNQAFLDAGDRKITVTGSPGEKKTLKLSANQSTPFKTVSVAQTQKSNGNVGWGNAAGSYHSNGKAAGQGAQIANFHPGQKLGTAFPHYDTADHLIIEIGSDGAPMTITLGEGLRV